MSKRSIKSMQLYPRPERVLDDLAALGFGPAQALKVADVNKLDQLHYHGTSAIDVAIAQCGVEANDKVLEVGSGWGGCARYIAYQTNAHVTAVELQKDYDAVAGNLTRRTGLADAITHVNADFLDLDLPQSQFDHVVSWLALFHIPNRHDYLGRIHNTLKPGGHFFAEDLYLIEPASKEEEEDFQTHLFPNSLVGFDTYLGTMKTAGFDLTKVDDMTNDWSEFTATRLGTFRQNRAAYEAIHGPQGYTIIETFYDKMAGYFERGLVGGVRFAATRRQ